MVQNEDLIKWSNKLKQFVGNLPTNCLSVFDHFLGLPFKLLISNLHLRENFCSQILENEAEQIFPNKQDLYVELVH